MDQLSKFRQFARKSVPPIRPVSSPTEGTNTTRRLIAIDWNLEMAVRVAGDGVFPPFSPQPPTRGGPPYSTVYSLVILLFGDSAEVVCVDNFKVWLYCYSQNSTAHHWSPFTASWSKVLDVSWCMALLKVFWPKKKKIWKLVRDIFFSPRGKKIYISFVTILFLLVQTSRKLVGGISAYWSLHTNI